MILIKIKNIRISRWQVLNENVCDKSFFCSCNFIKWKRNYFPGSIATMIFRCVALVTFSSLFSILEEYLFFAILYSCCWWEENTNNGVKFRTTFVLSNIRTVFFFRLNIVCLIPNSLKWFIQDFILLSSWFHRFHQGKPFGRRRKTRRAFRPYLLS